MSTKERIQNNLNCVKQTQNNFKIVYDELIAHFFGKNKFFSYYCNFLFV